uniref:Uncharacterized protein n=1 Tax=Molossus molossus TaxID=27622 RepID=A0A7J8I0H0_MOLMO|nr:hypothetical protein HJG59_007057 [Molossus molossus]
MTDRFWDQWYLWYLRLLRLLDRGSFRNDGLKASDVLPILKEKVAFVSGECLWNFLLSGPRGVVCVHVWHSLLRGSVREVGWKSCLQSCFLSAGGQKGKGELWESRVFWKMFTTTPPHTPLLPMLPAGSGPAGGAEAPRRDVPAVGVCPCHGSQRF